MTITLTLEILFTALAVLGSGAMIVLSRTRRPIGLFQRYVLVLLAPAPVWFFDQLLWNVCIDHRRGLGFPGWFWTVLLIFAILVGVCFSIHRHQLYHQVRIKYSPLAFAQLLGAAVALVLIVINLYGWKTRPHWVQHVHLSPAVGLWLFAVALVLIGIKFKWLFVAAALVVALAIASTLISRNGGHSHQAAPKPSVSSSASTPGATPPVLPYTQHSASNCTAGFNVIYDPNKGLDDVSAGIDTSNPTVARRQILAVAKHDPRYLFKLVEASPLAKDQFPQLTAFSQLQDSKSGNGCYSDLGRDVYDSYQGVLYSPKTKFVSGNAPAVGSNSGTNPNGSPFMEPPGSLTGDPRAVKITYANGQVVYVLHRCGNVFVPGTQTVPHVPVKTPAQPGTPTSHQPVCTLAPKQFENIVNCQYVKPAQSWECMQNPHNGCAPNPAHQDPQTNRGNQGQVTKQPSTVPSSAPSAQPTQPVNTSHPAAPTSGGYNGGSSSQPGTTAPPATPLPSGTGTGDPGGF